MSNPHDPAKERNKAGKALFQIQFMTMMMMVGRHEEAEEAIQKAMQLLTELEQELDGPVTDALQHTATWLGESDDKGDLDVISKIKAAQEVISNDDT